MKFLLRLVQQHESFRVAELKALAHLHGISNFEIVEYNATSPFCIVRLPDVAAARSLVSRSILTQSIHELWAEGSNYDELHACVQNNTADMWAWYSVCSFKFSLDTYQSTRTSTEQKAIIDSFSYLPFEGPIKMSSADEQFTVFENYEFHGKQPKQIYLGRFLAKGARDLVHKYTLKKPNMVLASPGKLMYDPFVGTGSLPIACSHFGAIALGSDMDGRSIRGRKEANVRNSFAQYGLQSRDLGAFVADLTHTPLRQSAGGFFNGIVCDPPYGVREGLKVLGHKDGRHKEVVYIDGKPAHLEEDYIPPRQPYSFEAMLVDILNFAADMLVEDGRLSMWMPTANENEQELETPTHSALELISECVQPFNKWSRRLLTYRRKYAAEVDDNLPSIAKRVVGNTADELNNFRKRFFQGFKSEAVTTLDL